MAAMLKIKFGAPKEGSKAEEKMESPEDDSSFTKADLGKGLAAAIKSGDGAAIFEAFKKLSNTTPSDDE